MLKKNTWGVKEVKINLQFPFFYYMRGRKFGLDEEKRGRRESGVRRSERREVHTREDSVSDASTHTSAH